jgi:hypothetical protein
MFDSRKGCGWFCYEFCLFQVHISEMSNHRIRRHLHSLCLCMCVCLCVCVWLWMCVWLCMWVCECVWVRPSFYHYIITNDKILHLKFLVRRGEKKWKEKLQSSNKAISVYGNIGAGNSEWDWHDITLSLAFWIITTFVTITVRYYRSTVLFVRTDVNTAITNTVVIYMV